MLETTKDKYHNILTCTWWLSQRPGFWKQQWIINSFRMSGNLQTQTLSTTKWQGLWRDILLAFDRKDWPNQTPGPSCLFDPDCCRSLYQLFSLFQHFLIQLCQDSGLPGIALLRSLAAEHQLRDLCARIKHCWNKLFECQWILIFTTSFLKNEQDGERKVSLLIHVVKSLIWE